MKQIAFSFEGRPEPSDLFSYGTQNRKLYEALCAGPVTNEQIVSDLRILKYTSRISDLREALRPHLMDIEATRLNHGLFEYSLKG
jgi:hypothetical protein